MRSQVAWIGLSLLSLLGAAAFTGCSEATDSPVGSAYPVTGKECATPGDTAPAADGCNDCTCGSDGTWSCTDIACSPGKSDAGAPAPLARCLIEDIGTVHCGDVLPATCKDGETWKHLCNTCTCDADGSWSCTDMACAPQCTPGESEWNETVCSGCDCNEDGFWVCTIGICPGIPICPEGAKAELGCMSFECKPTAIPGATELWWYDDACYAFN